MTPASTFMTDDPNVVTHRTVAAHWCASCWHWSWIAFTSWHRSVFLIAPRLPIRSFEVLRARWPRDFLSLEVRCTVRINLTRNVSRV